MKIVAVTTFNEEYYNNMAKHMVDTFMRFWPTDIELHVYLEDFKLPLSATNIVEHNVYDCKGLKEFLDWRGNHFTRRFAYKTYAFIDACKHLDADLIIYLDADSITYKPVDVSWLLKHTAYDKVCAYMGVTSNDGRENAETAIFFFNNAHPFAKEFMKHYENIYESRDINDRKRFGKPHDTWAFTECVMLAKQNGHDVLDFNVGRKHRSPTAKCELGNYFRHLKASSKHWSEKEDYLNMMIENGNNPNLKDLEKQFKIDNSNKKVYA
jgi:hypothetical protein